MEALETLRFLAEGVDPDTGNEFPQDSPYQRPRVIRALCAATAALEAHDERRRRRRDLPQRVGAPWSEDEDRRLVDAFDAARPLGEIARAHGRTALAVRARLIRLGKITGDGTPPS